MNISENITYAEAIRSQVAIRRGIDNTPSPEILGNMILTAEKVFQPIRKYFGVSIRIVSFYRSSEVNKILSRSSKTSDHMIGRAIDIQAIPSTRITNNDIFVYARDNLSFDQLIKEFPNNDGNPSWIHISYRKTGNRNMVLEAKVITGKTVYVKI